MQSSHQLRRTAAVPASEQTVSRRNAIQKLAVIPVLAPMVQAILPQQALAAEAAPETASPPAPPPAAKYKSFIARDFMLRYPDTFKIVEDSDSYIPNATGKQCCALIDAGSAY